MTTATTSPSTGKKPTHIAYHVRESANTEPFWTRIGCAWTHKDGEGFQLQLETVPLDGRITVRIASKASA